MEDIIAVQKETAGRRAAAYWFVDGLPEIFFGVLYMVLGSAGLAFGFHSTNPWLRGAMIAAALVFLLLFWKDRAILDYCKARLTYPRTGYVSPPAEPKPNRSWEVVTLSAPPPVDWNVTSFRTRTAFAFFVASRLVDIPIGRMANGRWRVPVVMALVALGVYLWNRLEPHRYSWQSASAIALAGILAGGLNVPPAGRQFLPLLIGGVWLLAHGVPTLVRYLRTYPAPKGEGA